MIQTLIVHQVVSAAALNEFGISISAAEVDEEVVALTAQIESSGGTLADAAAQQGLSLAAIPFIVEEDLIEQAIAESLSVAKPTPTEEEVLAAYKSALQSLTEVCASHILLPTEEEAQAALARIDNGERFENVAAELGTDGTAEVGGDLGCGPASNYVAEFATAVIEADLDVPTGPVESQFGYHVILVRGRTETPFEDVRSEIEASLREDWNTTLLSDWMLAVMGRADVTIEVEYGTWKLEPFPTVVPPA